MDDPYQPPKPEVPAKKKAEPTVEDERWKVIGGDPDEQLKLNPVAEFLFHWFMMALGGAIVFAIGGGLAFLIGSRRMGYAETPATAWIRFCIGGTAALAFVIVLLFGKKRPFK